MCSAACSYPTYRNHHDVFRNFNLRGTRSEQAISFVTLAPERQSYERLSFGVRRKAALDLSSLSSELTEPGLLE